MKSKVKANPLALNQQRLRLCCECAMANNPAMPMPEKWVLYDLDTKGDLVTTNLNPPLIMPRKFGECQLFNGINEPQMCRIRPRT